MALLKAKPTSPGRRFAVKVVDRNLYDGEPYRPLLAKKVKSGGRNNKGRITSRHVGGGHKQRYRMIDFKRNKDGIPARVERIEYDPNRSANIALVLYAAATVGFSSSSRRPNRTCHGMARWTLHA